MPRRPSPPAASVLESLPLDLRVALERASSVRTLAAGEALIEVGDEVTTAGLVLSGVLREVYVDARGVERTRSFCFEGDFVGSWADVLAKRPSRTRVEALRRSRIRCYSVQSLLALEREAPALVGVFRTVAERLYLRKSDREFELLTMDAAQRYRALLDQMPRVEDVVQLQHIASYLGITPVYLSRLRRRARAAARG